MLPNKINNTFTKTSKAAILKDVDINYKNYSSLSKVTSTHGRILSKRLTGLTSKRQRQLAHSIKIARFLALLPYCGIAK